MDRPSRPDQRTGICSAYMGNMGLITIRSFSPKKCRIPAKYNIFFSGKDQRMNTRAKLLTIVIALIVSATPAIAQQKLGDFLAETGYDSMLGKWTATDGAGTTYELQYKWILDKHAILMIAKIGDLKYQGMIMYAPYSQQILQIGADNKGGTMKGAWTEDYEGASHRIEYLKADGTTQKIEHVHIAIDNNSFKIKEYAVESDGWRSSQPNGELTFTRVKK